MEPDADRFAVIEEKINKIYISVEKTRKYFFWTMVVTVVTIVVPAILLAIAVPFFLSSYVGSIQSATNLIQ